MTQRTINNKSLENVVAELSAPFDSSLFKPNTAGFEYLPYEEYLNRMNEVVGVLNYDFEICSTTWESIGDKKHVSVVGKLALRDDSGDIVSVKSATGDADVICKKETGEAVKPGNDAKTAAHDAFKGCCRMFGMADEQLRDFRKGKKVNKSSGSSSKPKDAATEESFRVIVTGGFSSMPNGMGYKAPSVVKDTGENVTLVIFKEGIEAITKHMPIADFITKYKGREFSVIGYHNSFTFKNGKTEEQLVMLRPSCGKEAC